MVSVASARNQARGLGSVVTFVVFGWECIAIPETFPLLHQLETKIVDLNNSRCRSIATFGRLYLFAQSALTCVVSVVKLNFSAMLHLEFRVSLQSCLCPSRDGFSNSYLVGHGGKG